MLIAHSQQTVTISTGSGTHKGSKPFRGMPCSMQKLSRLHLFHLGQVKEKPILRNVKQHAQAQQTATISPGSGNRATHSDECSAACSSSADCKIFHLGQVREHPILKNAKQHQTVTICVRYESNPFWRISSSMLKLSRLQIFHLGQVSEQPIQKNAKQPAQVQQTATISPGSGKRVTYSEEYQSACAHSQQTATISPGSGKGAPILRNAKQHAQDHQMYSNYFTWVR